MSTVLIVEDNDKNLKLVRDVLQLRGHRTVEAMTGADGLRLAAARPPDLVLLDIQLPDLDGISVLKKLREQPALHDTPILAVSASAMPDDQRRIIASGFDAYITKPIDVKRFIEVVERYLARGRA